MTMPGTVEELKALLADLPDDTPIKGEMQGEEHWDWTVYVSPQDENDYGQDTFIFSMDL